MTKSSVVARESQHTIALPVHVEQNPYNKHEILIVDSGNDRFASIHTAQPHAEESAEFIVRACNAHAQIVSALRECKAELISFHGTILDNDVVAPRLSKLIDKAEQALRLAQGEK